MQLVEYQSHKNRVSLIGNTFSPFTSVEFIPGGRKARHVSRTAVKARTAKMEHPYVRCA